MSIPANRLAITRARYFSGGNRGCSFFQNVKVGAWLVGQGVPIPQIYVSLFRLLIVPADAKILGKPGIGSENHFSSINKPIASCPALKLSPVPHPAPLICAGCARIWSAASSPILNKPAPRFANWHLLDPGLPFDIRLAYHRSAAFLENQWQRWEPALDHARQAIAILENLADAPALAEMWADVSAVQVNQRAWSAAQESLDRAHHYLDPASPPRVRANVTCREGFLHLHLGNLNQALACFQEAEKDLMGLDASGERKDFYLLTLVLSGLGTLYERLGDKEKSLDAFRRVLPIAEEHRLRPRLPWHFLHTGRVPWRWTTYRKPGNTSSMRCALLAKAKKK